MLWVIPTHTQKPLLKLFIENVIDCTTCPFKTVLPCSLSHGYPAKDDSSEPPLQPGVAMWLNRSMGSEEGKWATSRCLRLTGKLSVQDFILACKLEGRHASSPGLSQRMEMVTENGRATGRNLIHSFFFFNLSIYSWLTCCFNLCWTAKWFNYTHTHTHTHTHILFCILSHYGLSQDIEYSSLCYIVGPCCLSTLYIN